MSSRNLLSVLVGLAMVAGHVCATPRLSEFMAENTETIADEDGDFSDWVEIHNPDAAAVNLAGYALTDDPLLPAKWVFPNVSIPSGGHLVVFASGKNRANPAGTLHTNFSLEVNGEYLALTAPDGTTKVTEFAPAFPPQETDRSYGSAAPLATSSLIAQGATSRRIVPSANIANWNTLGFVDTTWTSGQTGIGYENNPGDVVNYTSLIGPNGNIGPQMFNVRGTCYIRIPFTIANATGVFNLKLRMKYDDGFIAYINGTKVAADLDPAVPAFNSTATGARPDTDAVVFRDFDISQFRTALVNGTNVLAIQGLNQAANSSDFIILPVLDAIATQAGQPLVTGYFPEPTPGSLNGATTQGFVKDTQFSADRGFYTAPFSVTITTNTPGAEIRYTTNGSEPTATTGTVYTAPIPISTSTVLRAAAFRPTWTPANVDTQTYIFPAAAKAQPAAPAGYPATWGHKFDFSTFQLSTTVFEPADYQMDPEITGSGTYGPLIIPALTTTLPVMAISCDTTSIFGLNGIYSDGRVVDGLEIPASVEFFGPGSGDGFHTRCGLRIHGGDAPIEHPKKPFRLYFRKEYGATKLDFPIYPNADIKRYDRLQLRPGGHDGWSVPFGGTANDLAYHATYCRDQFLRQTEIDQGRLAPQGRYVHLYINGLYWGFYNLHEVPGDDYFRSHLGGAEDDWDVVEQTGGLGYKVVDGNGDAMDVLLSLCNPPTRPSDPLIYDQIQQYLDLDDYIDHMMVMIWAGQNDWMGPVFRGTVNYSRFFNKNWDAGRLSRGLFQTSFLFSTWDAEISMGTQLVSATVGHRIVDFNFTRVGELGFGGTPGPPAAIYNALRSNADFRKRFGDRLHKRFFNGGVMSVGNNQIRLTALRNQLMLPIVAESARWGDVNGPNFTRNAEWLTEMNWMNNTFMTGRNDTVISQFRAIGLYPAIEAPVFNQFGGVTDPSFQLEMTDPLGGGTIFYTTDGTDPQQASGSIYTTLVDATSPGKYWVPTSAALGDTWKNVADPANIGIWSNGSAAVGYDQATTFQPHISTTVAEMLTTNATIYTRIPFTIASQAQLNSITALTLRLKCDDGCVAYINGSTPVATINAPAAQTFNSTASAVRADIDAQIYQTVNVSSHINRLVVGTNYLCIQGLNISATDDDFLLSAQLLATTGNGTGGVAPAALPYSTPVTLAQTSTVKARVVNGGTWSALTEATFIVGEPASAANLVISEFNYEPADPNPAEFAAGFVGNGEFEYIELHNPTSAIVELSGVRFTFGVEFDFASSPIRRIQPGGRVLVVRNAAAFAMRHGTGQPVAGVFENSSALANGGERLILLAADGLPICDFTYDNNAPWPNPPANSGLSLVLIRPETLPDHSLPQNWRLSRAANGTPNSVDTLTYPAWLAANGGTGSEFGDRDEDGLGNLLEYGLAGNPSQSSRGDLPVVGVRQFTPGGIAGDYLTLTFRRQRGADDIGIHVEFSTDLIAWPENGTLVDQIHHLDGTTTETWRHNIPISATTSQFGRVRIVK